MKMLIALIAVPSVLMFLAGCQTAPYQGQAREVKKKPQEEGVIALATNHRDEDRAKAQEKMNANCAPYPAQVLEEGEVVTGQATTANEKETDRASTEHTQKFLGMNFAGGEAAGKNKATSTTTTNLKEWQISYKCDKHKASAKR
jgi:hypothetical protein